MDTHEFVVPKSIPMIATNFSRYFIYTGNMGIKRYFSSVPKYKVESSELLINNAIIALNNNTNPLADSNLKNHLKGLVILFIILFN